MRRIILVPVLIVVALLAIVGGVAYWIYNGYMYYSTDDAQVSGNIVNISAPANGQLTTLSVNVNDKVTAGQTIATITPAPSVSPTGTPVKYSRSPLPAQLMVLSCRHPQSRGRRSVRV